MSQRHSNAEVIHLFATPMADSDRRQDQIRSEAALRLSLVRFAQAADLREVEALVVLLGERCSTVSAG